MHRPFAVQSLGPRRPSGSERRSISAAVLLAGLLSLPRPAAADTTIPPGALGTTTWTSAGGPYLIDGQVKVSAGATLTIEPGVTVQFRSGELLVEGTLLAVGTAASPIEFKSPTGTAGSWSGITLQGTAAAPIAGSRLEHVTVSDAGVNGHAGLTLLYARAQVSNCVIRNGKGSGIYGRTGGVADISATTLTGNGGAAIEFSDGSVDPALEAITATGNGKDAIVFGAGTFATSRTWKNLGLPYLAASTTVAPGATLTIEPGVTALFDGRLLVNGTLQAIGTADHLITLGSQSKAPGSWFGVTIQGSASAANTGSRLANVIVTDAGANGEAGLTLLYARAQVSSCVIRDGTGRGIYGRAGGVADVSATRITGNGGAAIEFSDGSVDPALDAITATGNGKDAIVFGAGTFATSRTWKNLGLPYLVGSTTVAPGAALTIEPGVTALFDGRLLVDGTLHAIGTADRPITLASQKGAPGSWFGVTIQGSASAPNTGSRLANVIVTDAGANGEAGLTLLNARAQVSSCIIRNGTGRGIYGRAGGVADVSATRITGNGGAAIEFSDGSVDPVLDAITATGNGKDAIVFGAGTLATSRTWKNLGLPYLVASTTVAPGATLTIEPGVTALFDGRLLVDGTLHAIGTADRPITLASQKGAPGSWFGVTIRGSASAINTGSRLEHVTVSDSGVNAEADLTLKYARAHLIGCAIQNSSSHGIVGTHAGGTVIEWSSFANNGGANSYAVYNTTAGAAGEAPISAVNDWWGSATGPTPGSAGAACNPNADGTGSRVSNGVDFLPFRTALASGPVLVEPIGQLNIAITPQRWYVPADGLSRAWIKIAVRDGEGQPVQGRAVLLASSLGQVTDGAVTDVQGESYAYLVSNAPGTAQISAGLARQSECEPFRPASTTVTFTASDQNPLFPNAAAPYLADIAISPLPVVEGVPTKVQARLKNPNAFPISVNAEFGFAQRGIGLQFGPFGTVAGRVMEANSEAVLEADWAPTVSGHYCFQVRYDATAVAQGGGSAGLARKRASVSGGMSGKGQKNVDVKPACEQSSEEASASAQLQGLGNGAAWAAMGIGALELGAAPGSELSADPSTSFGLKYAFGLDSTVIDALKMADSCGKALQGMKSTPPKVKGKGRYKKVTKPPPVKIPLNSPDGKKMIEFLNDLTKQLSETVGRQLAMSAALQGKADAAEAGDLTWAAQQSAAYDFYRKKTGEGLVALADATDAFLAEARSEGITADVVTVGAAQTYLGLLRTRGFTADDVAVGKSMGLTDDDLAWFLDRILAMSAEDLAVDRMALLAQFSAAWRALGNAYLAPPRRMAPPSAAPNALTAAPGRLARVWATESVFELANPLAAEATIDLRARLVDLPPDWTVTLTPSTTTLGPGEQTQVAARLEPGGSVVQGTQPRLAVEAFAGETLLGGVVIDTWVPTYVAVGSGCTGAGDRAEGDACDCTMDCQSGDVCATLNGSARACRVPCDPSAPNPCAGADQTCGPALDFGAVCISPTTVSNSGCGCGAASGSSLGAAIVLAAFGWRSRRRRAAVRPAL